MRFLVDAQLPPVLAQCDILCEGPPRLRREIVRIVCLNIRSGGGDRWSRLLDYFDAYDPDVVVMTEWRATTREATERWSASRGMHWCFANDGATSNGVCIAAKQPLTAVGARRASNGRNFVEGGVRLVAHACLLFSAGGS